MSPNEFIHPSVRVRREYGGLDHDDTRKWVCRALKNNGAKIIQEEHIGIWERMFVRVNAKKLVWEAKELAAKKKAAADAEANRWALSKWAFGSPNLEPAGNGHHELQDVVSW